MNVNTPNVVIHPAKNSLLCVEGEELSLSGDVEHVNIDGILNGYLLFVRGEGEVSD